jgi:GR25 family glycosyltransferase involved in LPS biosynthesis
MLTVELMGGLGNQLFQIFTLIAYSKKYNQPFLIEKKTSLPGQYVTRDVYWNNLLDKLSYRLIQNPLQYPLIREKSFEYEELPQQVPNKNNNFKLYGYFQSYKYFQDYKNDILNDLDWNTKRDTVLQKLTKQKDVKDMVSLHFRVGDYAKLQDYHPIMTLEYYTNAIKVIQAQAAQQAQVAQMQILYFCEDNDLPFVTSTFINPLKMTFPSITFVQCEDKLDDWEQMIVMSACKHHIIGNSSFSWWGAYLAEPKDTKIVCYPDKWFGPAAGQKNTSDLFQRSWTKCETGIGKEKFLLENVYYINLEERKDRKALVESELTKLKWKYERFNAVRLKDGRAGCSMSHLKLLEMAKAKQLEYIVIVEDDIQFMKPEQYNYMLIEFNRFMKSNNIEHDVLLLAGNLRPPVARVNNFITRISKSWTTTGYIVKKHYYDTMIQNFKEGVNLLIKNPQIKGQFEIDTYWHKLQIKDRWYILSPRTVTQRPNFSTIENRYTDYNYLMLD